jgi:outer membrane protein
MRNRRFIARFAFAAGALALPFAMAVQAKAERSIALGAAAVVKPKYEGSDGYETYAIPLFIPRFTDSADENPSLFKSIRSRVKFRGLDDIRLRVFDSGAFEAGAVTGYIGDRDQGDGRLLRGWGDVDGGLVLGGYAGVHVGNVFFDAALIDKVSGDDAGYQVRLGAEVERRVSPRSKVKARAGTTFASDDYMQTYFGVTPTQAAMSTVVLSEFNPEAGLKDMHVELGAEIDLSKRWVMKASGGYARLLGDAADSPVVESANQWTGTLGFAYRFNVGGGAPDPYVTK